MRITEHTENLVKAMLSNPAKGLVRAGERFIYEVTLVDVPDQTTGNLAKAIAITVGCKSPILGQWMFSTPPAIVPCMSDELVLKMPLQAAVQQLRDAQQAVLDQGSLAPHSQPIMDPKFWRGSPN